MVENDSFAQLMIRLKEGDEAAATEVFGRFIRRLIGLASQQFDSWLRYRVDIEGVVQSAYKSFFAGQGEGRFELSDWDSLWGLLAVITVRKCYRRRDYLRAECRDRAREVALGPAHGDGDGDERGRSGSWREAVDHEPTPLEAAILAETVERLLTSLERPERDIVELSLQGYTTPEIAARLGRSRRTVRRVRERVKDCLLRFQDENEARKEPLYGPVAAARP
jgi:RNA polymerase sigma-70 factor (ECF subfamily)